MADDKKKMTVAEMIAAARKADSKKGDGEAASPPPASSAPAETTPAPEQAAAPAAPAAPAPLAKDPKKMSVAEMLAAARAEKSKPAGGAAPAAAPAAPAAKPAAAKAAPAAAPAAAPKEKPPGTATEKDTASILAAARKTAKAGPVSKSEVTTDKAKPAKTKLEVPPMPERPEYARPRPAAATATATDRRGFMATTMAVFFGSSVAIGFTSLAVTHLLWLLGLARFMFPNVLIEPPTRFRVGSKDDYSPGQVSEKYKAQFGTWVVRYEYEGQPMIFALKTVCTHLGCTPNWLEGEQKFKCPCHGSGFYKDGINFEGPAPRPLERYKITEVDGQLEVDKSATFNEETGQWADPASRVLV